MKTYAELTQEQQEQAVERALSELLTDIAQNGLRFDDAASGDDLQARIDRAGETAEQMQTPWFWPGYIMDTCADDLQAMARATAEDALYAEPGEYVMHGIAA